MKGLYLFTTQSRFFTTLRKKPFENIVRIGENAGSQRFLLFPGCFLPFQNQISIVHLHLLCHFANVLKLGPV